MIFGVIAYTQSNDTFLDYSNTDEIFMLVVPIFALTGVLMSNVLFKQMMNNSSKMEGLRAKLMRFQTASLVKYALIEGPALIGIVAFFNTQNLAYFYIAGVLLFYLYLLRPTKDKIERGLQLKGQEKDQFNRLDQTIP
nr:hypothetical protein [Allomuricauda sp.]